MEEKAKNVLLLSLQIRWDMGYCFQIEGMTQDKPEINEMKYLYTITFTAFSPYYNAHFEYQMSVIDKNGNLGQRALLNRIEKYDGRRPSDSITRIECACYAN
jgi:hypothetical protein